MKGKIKLTHVNGRVGIECGGRAVDISLDKQDLKDLKYLIEEELGEEDSMPSDVLKHCINCNCGQCPTKCQPLTEAPIN